MNYVLHVAEYALRIIATECTAGTKWERYLALCNQIRAGRL
jgi:hypothetical protein